MERDGGGLEKNRGEKSMTGNLGICRTEIGSHLKRLSKRKADFTADGSAVAGLQTPGAPPGLTATSAAVADLLTRSHSTGMGSSQSGKHRAIFSSSLSLFDHVQIKSWFGRIHRFRQLRISSAGGEAKPADQYCP